MVGRDDPASIGFALDVARHAPHRFKPADMGFGETFAGDGVVLQMGVDRIAPGIGGGDLGDGAIDGPDRSEEHTSELQSLMRISYAVFCLKKKNIKSTQQLYRL